MKSSKELAQELLAPAGITLGGTNPWDPQVHDERVFDRFFRDGIIAIGESYMDGWWDVADLPEMVARVARSAQIQKISAVRLLPIAVAFARARVLNLQTR